jgi:hypothetical protein
MLTRHLYRCDEVSAALMSSIVKGRSKEAAFWTQELIDSGLIDQLWQSLITAWIWWFGVGRLELIRQLFILQEAEEVSDDDLVELSCQMAQSSKTGRDGSVLALLILGLTDSRQIDRVGNPTGATLVFQEKAWTPLEQTFIRACFQGKTRLAWNLIKGNWSDSTWNLLHTIQNKKAGSSTLRQVLENLQKNCTDTMLWPARACAVAAVCLTPDQLATSLYALPTGLPIEIASERTTWKEKEGRRCRRVFEIPSDCLMYITERGRTLTFQQDNLGELRSLPSDVLRGCPYWDEQYEEHKPDESDEGKEAFWSTNFPDDIPDEWSLADQKKSHGTGVQMSGEKPSLSRFLRSWYLHGNYPCRAVWMGVSEACKVVTALEKDGTLDDLQTGLDTLYWAHSEGWNATAQTWNHTPVSQRILEIC